MPLLPIAFKGGLNLVEPAIALSGSDLIYCKNMEPYIYGGYRQVAGFERFDGQTKPSETIYTGVSPNVTPDTYFYETSANQALYDTERESNRTAIGAVPGTGAVQGIAIYNDVVYAFRSNGTITKCYKSTASGWTEVTAFTTPALTPGGTFQFAVHNFGSGPVLYGVDGVNPPFSFDGTTYTNIVGIAGQTPSYIAGHDQYLFLGYDNEIAHCTVGAPTDWTTGEVVWNLKDTVTGFAPMVNGLIAVFCDNSTHILYEGSGTAAYELKEHSNTTGSYPYCIATETVPLYLNSNGVTQLQDTQTTGGFQSYSVTRKVHPWIKKYASTAIGAVMDIDNKLYRLYFSDGRVLNMQYDGNKAGDILVSEYEKNLSCVTSGRINGEFVIFAGESDNGYVYQMENGLSLDGSDIDVIMKTAFENAKSPNTKKEFTFVDMTLDAPDAITVYFTPDFSYGSSNNPTALSVSELSSGGGAWDVSEWDSFFWSEQSVGTSRQHIDGRGDIYNIALVVSVTTKNTRQVTFQGVNYQFKHLKGSLN